MFNGKRLAELLKKDFKNDEELDYVIAGLTEIEDFHRAMGDNIVVYYYTIRLHECRSYHHARNWNKKPEITEEKIIDLKKYL